MKKKALTKKEINEAIGGLSDNDNLLIENDNLLRDKLLRIENFLGLYFEFRKIAYKEDPEEFNKFVTSRTEKAEEFEQQRSKDTEGA